MFADVAGFTAVSEKLDPEEDHQTMDGCCRILVDEIHCFKGTVGEFRGDGVMGLFGAPIAHAKITPSVPVMRPWPFRRI